MEVNVVLVDSEDAIDEDDKDNVIESKFDVNKNVFKRLRKSWLVSGS